MFSWTLCFITNKKGTESSKILKIFIHAPLHTRDDVRSYFPEWCGVLETTMWQSRQASTTAFPLFPYSRKVMIALRRSLYGVVYDRRVLGLFDPLPPAVLTGFPQEANISLGASVGGILFLCAVVVVFHSRHQSTLIPVPPSIRPS